MRDSSVRLWIPSAAVFAASCLCPAIATAQLEEVIVTAERREAFVQDVPIAVSAYDQELLEDLQIDETMDLLTVVPNLFGGNNTGLGTSNMYYLRGQGNDESIATFDPPVGTYVDGVYMTRQNANNFAFFDVERIEVLRGPQGTLFGRNTTGGAINVVLAKPAEQSGGYLEAGFGRYNEYLLRGSVDVPVSRSLLMKFSAYTLEDDGWLKNEAVNRTFNQQDATGVRAAVRFIGSNSLTWDLSADYVEDDEGSIHGFLVGSRRVSNSLLPNGLPPGFEQKTDYGNHTESVSVTSDVGWEVGGGVVNFIVGYRELQQDFLLNFPGLGSDDFFWIDNLGDHDMLSAELKWVGSLFDDRVKLVSGIYYMDEDNTTDFADYLFGAIRLADRVLDNGTESWAAYAQADIGVGERGTLTLGARYTDETKDVAVSDSTGAGVLTTAGLVAAGIPVEQSESVVTPRFAYSHDFSDDLMGYVSATRGFKAGGWNARGTSPAAFQPFGPEFIWSYELGMRAEWLDQRLRTNATIFYSDLEDLQTTAAVAGQFLTTNAGGLEVKGFELELNAVPTDRWNVFLSLGLQDAKYVSLPPDCVVPNATLAAYDVNCNPAEPKRSPDITLTLGTSFEIPLSGLGASLVPQVTARHIGANVAGTRGLGVNGDETILNAGISLVDDDDRWRAVVECKNCTDEEYITNNLFELYWTEPMTWMATVRFNFGAQ